MASLVPFVVLVLLGMGAIIWWVWYTSSPEYREAKARRRQAAQLRERAAQSTKTKNRA
jgi:hypothetical protein